MTTKQRKEMYARIEKHGRDLLAIFPDATKQDPIALCKALRRIETRANNAACEACNTQAGADAWDSERDRALSSVNRILGNDNAVPVFINADPRGYALKIDDDWMKRNNASLHRDLGGYGIIAPDLS